MINFFINISSIYTLIVSLLEVLLACQKFCLRPRLCLKLSLSTNSGSSFVAFDDRLEHMQVCHFPSRSRRTATLVPRVSLLPHKTFLGYCYEISVLVTKILKVKKQHTHTCRETKLKGGPGSVSMVLLPPLSVFH